MMRIVVASDNRERFIWNEIQELRRRGHSVTMKQENKEAHVRSALTRADIVWCDFVGRRARRYSSQARRIKGAKLVVRVHAPRELRSIREIHWQGVDLALFDQPVIMRQARRRDRSLRRTRCEVVRLAVDTEIFQMLPGRKWPDRVGMLGMVRSVKDMEGVLDVLGRLRRERIGLGFWSKGYLSGERAYMQNLERRARRLGVSHRFTPWGSEIDRRYKEGDPRVAWLNQIGMLVSNSRHEGTHLACAEAMACGCLTAIRNWPGASWLYPSDMIVGGKTSLHEQLRWYGRLRGSKRRQNGERLREWTVNHFSIPVIVDRLESLFESLL